MILNTFLKTQNVKLSTQAKLKLGINISRRYHTKFPETPLKKVRIKEGTESFEVVDYPKEFLLEEGTKAILTKFLKRGKKIFLEKLAATKKEENAEK
jgi:predicted DNA-binding antitoxin AbrB/MazE fold protein